MTQFNQIKLFAKSVKDLKVIAALCQDSVGTLENIRRNKKEKSFSVLINRFKWENSNLLKENKGSPLRVETVLFFRWVLSVKSLGLNKKGLSKYFYLLDINYKSFDGKNSIRLIFSGNVEILLEVEYLEAFMKDIGEVYYAKSGKFPTHKY
mgnify:CR=1 FL=1